MKIRLLLLPFALVIGLPLALHAQASAPAPAPEHKKKADETELSKVMEKMNGAWRKLRKQAGDATANASSLELIATIKVCGEKALAFKPAKVADVPAADQEKFVADYQQEMKEFAAQVAKLEAAFKANDNAAAQELIQKIGALQKEAHKEFKRPDL